ncbi:adenosylmethionine--8-amino-7-oxononanoate transaminase [Paractinoplanes atraurantiacus]|uniref:Adenosylmethionine-8-amino-7-oxononanoate aminotransferase n=1 Tax=Paractinoplanes atraurantiacus TaxID=1036182 RepID=A0A285J8N7_9ACTN|nr:adenosylmethionine--8-amino-7-oxononanoate transaminase [Actinoplanes atraurantiacus]SNY56217.1 adenosylmethionine-8-amino-7-oxononanoate aminotransferase [Actinoplanes atraurantiacus]
MTTPPPPGSTSPPAGGSGRLLALDRAHVWHPYGPMPGRSEPYLVESASGVRLKLADGRELVDGMSSWWAAIHGYRHPVLDEALIEQSRRMSHVMFGGLTHEPAIELAAELVELAPRAGGSASSGSASSGAPGLEHVFLCDSGSVSVEVAFKMALQAQRALGHPGRRRLATWRGGYHGDTFHPMSVCDPDGGMHSLWSGVLPAQVFVDAPPVEFDEAYAEKLVEMIARHSGEIAAVVVEPVVQGAGGMRFHDPRYLRVLREATEAYGILLIFDEIATGFGRTGKLFAAEHAGVVPDIMCVGKALTGGYLTLAAALCTTAVAEAISGGAGGGLMHGPTFMGNPLACAVARASLRLLRDGAWVDQVRLIGNGLRDGLEPLRGRPGVADVRVLGAMGVVQLDHDVDMHAATAAAVAEGVWLRPFRDLVYTMPPYVTGAEDVARIVAGVAAAATVG